MMREGMTWLSRSLLTTIAFGCLATPAMAQIENVTVPDKPANAHWLWYTDLVLGDYDRSVLYDIDKGEIIGRVDNGWEGLKVEVPHSGNEFYSVGVYLARGYRGTRTDVVTVWDKHTLFPLREIPISPKTIKGWPDPTLIALGDDEAFLFVQMMTPATTVGVVDLKNGKFAGELENTGCAHVYAAGKRRFMTMCGDGSLVAVNFDDAGHEVSRKRYSGFFDADNDPLHASGARTGDVWYFVSHRGQVHSVDVSGPELKFLPTWQVAVKEGDKTWVPGAWMQSLAIHKRLGRLYVAMHLSDLKPKGSGFDFHAKDGTQIWSFDIKTKKLVNKLETKMPISHIAVSQDDSPVLYAGEMWAITISAFDEKTGHLIRDISVPGMPTVLQPLD